MEEVINIVQCITNILKAGRAKDMQPTASYTGLEVVHDKFPNLDALADKLQVKPSEELTSGILIYSANSNGIITSRGYELIDLLRAAVEAESHY